MRFESILFVGAMAVFAPDLCAQGGPSRQELEMPAKSPEYRGVAERFVAAAAARDTATLEKMLSPSSLRGREKKDCKRS